MMPPSQGAEGGSCERWERWLRGLPPYPYRLGSHISRGRGLSTAGTWRGGGTFTWFSPVGQPPFPIIAAGSWRARTFLRFTPTDPPVYGVHGAGILDMEVELRPIRGRRLLGAMRVVCKIGAGGMVTGEEEGVALALRNGPEFEQVTGLTLFIPGR
jgi:hypothetical protein